MNENLAALKVFHPETGTNVKYSPDQERDDHGRFGSGGGGASKEEIAAHLDSKVASYNAKSDASYAKGDNLQGDKHGARADGYQKAADMVRAGKTADDIDARADRIDELAQSRSSQGRSETGAKVNAMYSAAGIIRSGVIPAN